MFSRNILNVSKLVKTIDSKFVLNLRLLSVSSQKHDKAKNVAVVLSGCGVYDGTEIIEATSVIIHLSRLNANISFFSPNIEQLHVINHATGEILPETRNVLVESARISRGNIQPIEKLSANSFQALFIPGGFGASKNLSDYAINQLKCTVNKQVERVVNEFVIALKPIGFCCISPVIAAKLLPKCEITVGKKQKRGEWPYGETVVTLRLFGASVIERDVDEIQVDKNYKLVSTPAFMKNASYYEVFTGIGKMVDEVLRLTD